MWSKCARAIMVAARNGGPDPAMNLTLRYAIDEARSCNMPKDNITRAIDKGAGTAGGESYEEVSYEGYGPGGVAIIVDGLTDNKTRTVTEVRTAFKKAGCSLGASGSVSYMFQTRGQILIEAGKTDEDALMEAALEAGAEDVIAPESDEDSWTVLSEASAFIGVREAIEKAGIEIGSAEITKLPDTTQQITGDDVRKLMNLTDALEDNDDVQKVFSNADISAEELANLG